MIGLVVGFVAGIAVAIYAPKIVAAIKAKANAAFK